VDGGAFRPLIVRRRRRELLFFFGIKYSTMSFLTRL